MKLLGRVFSYFTWALLAFLVVQKIIVWNKESQQKGLPVQNKLVQVIQANGTTALQPLLNANQKKILIFWATWCAPCKLELSRVQSMIDNHTLDPHKVIAISLYEDPQLVWRTSQERKYSFPIGVDPRGEISQDFKVTGTPTTVYVADEKIQSISTGLSLLLEKSFKGFLASP